MNKYDLLGIPRNASLEQVKRAYQQAALKLHPDKASPNTTGTADDFSRLDPFRAVQEAWETLRDPERRADYDERLEAASKHATISEDVNASDMQLCEDGVLMHPCRCGEAYEVTQDELREGLNVVPCSGCSLNVRVLPP
ncbi:heat shock protein 40 like protein/ DnaJ domain-containing protein [Tribonema minus]|uniref:Heat shock protein 40 like protein/ DnaJ domain-containing protein n=1 Tax=Tribonema minus TaxID=303371 RepID=A0A836CL58_9STRA|nr:heat shock protein 40 like protein/ DnaJ domain-containing protein [Tribonema minus]